MNWQPVHATFARSSRLAHSRMSGLPIGTSPCAPGSLAGEVVLAATWPGIGKKRLGSDR
jgi:hypothetical protein